jgi:hypothetical protein
MSEKANRWKPVNRTHLIYSVMWAVLAVGQTITVAHGLTFEGLGWLLLIVLWLNAFAALWRAFTKQEIAVASGLITLNLNDK